MTGRGKAALGLAGLVLAIGGVVASHVLGSSPAERGAPGPLPLCPDMPNCERVRVRLPALPDTVRAAALDALTALAGWTGRTDMVTPTELGAEAEIVVGPFRDDLAFAVEPSGSGSVLWIRSASRLGRSDLGMNRMRVDALVETIRTALG